MRRDPAEGGRAAGTPWEIYDVTAIGRMLADQGSAAQWRHAIAWRKAAELAADHAQRVRVHREHLAAKWSPRKSPAAAAYLGRLDAILARMDQVHELAATNLKVISAGLEAIHQAQNDIRPLQRSHASAPEGSPEREELNERARTVMRTLGGELIAAKMQLREPPPAAPFPDVETDSETLGGDNPPPIPRPRVRSIAAAANDPADLDFAPSTALPSVGPSLGAVIGPVDIRPGGPPPPLPSTSEGSAQISPSLPAGLALRPHTGQLTDRSSIHPGGRSVGTAVPGRGAGGVIGPIDETPASPASRAAEPVVRRVNPAGGVIGATPAEASHPLMGPVGSSGVGSAGTNTGRRLRRWSLESPWEVRRGTPSVVLPPEEPGPHDPGPAIGLNR